MKLKMRNKVTPEFTMAAMTDFVFQLLIIFMLMSTLVSQSNVMDMNLPSSSSTQTSSSNVVVAVDKDLNYMVSDQPVQKEQIPGVLKQMIGDNKDVTVELAIDENVPHKYFVELVDIISVQNAYKIGIQTRPQK
jgi:biopolymer transport protein ExbD